MKAKEDQFQRNRKETVDLSWLDIVDPEIEQRLLPMERAILAALRTYSTIFGRKTNRAGSSTSPELKAT